LDNSVAVFSNCKYLICDEVNQKDSNFTVK
jgi:hypothetical protein